MIPGVTGCLWAGGPDGGAAVRSFDDAAIEPGACVRSAARFAPARFREGVGAQVDAALLARERDGAFESGRAAALRG